MSLASYNFVQEDLRSLFADVNVEQLELLKGSNVCITGGTGFVGTWLCETINFLNENYKYDVKVWVIDRDIEKMKKTCPHLFNSTLFSFQAIDVKNLLDLPKEINYVIHAAGQPDSRYHMSNPVDTMNSISLGTDVVLRCAERLTHLKMFLNLSSSLVYGSFYDRSKNISIADYMAIDETSVSNVYAVAKKYSETQTIAYKNQFRVPVCILRPFTFIGPHQSLQGPWAVNNFISNVLEKKTIKVLGDGETVRSFLYASDMAFWILNVLLKAESGSVFNLGSSVPTTIKELANEVRSVEGGAEVTYHGGTSAMHKKSRMVPDITPLCEKFDLSQTVSLSDAVKRTIQWHLLSNKL